MIFHETFASNLAGYDAAGELSLVDVRTAIRNANGTKPSLFVPEMSYELLTKQQISRLQAPSLKCVEMVYEELISLASVCGESKVWISFSSSGSETVSIAGTTSD